MIPKIFYLVVCLLVALVAATPVGEQAGTKGQDSQLKPGDPIDVNTHVKKFKPMGNLGVKNMNIGEGFNGYATRLELKASVTDKHIAGLAEAAWWEMYNQFKEDVKASPADRALATRLPTVMTALKVGNEVFLASSLKGGGYIYDRNGLKELDDKLKKEEETNKEGFTSVLRDTQGLEELMEALVNCRKESIERTKTKQINTPEKQSSKHKGQGPRRGGSASSNSDKNRGPSPQQSDPGANKSKKKDPSQGSRNTAGGSTGSSSQTSPGLLKHRNEGACGEIMASLEYYRLNPTKSLKNLEKESKPTVVAWEEKAGKDKTKVLTGKVNHGGIKPPCGEKSLTDEDGCGEGWGCEAFTGKKGMNFHVVPTGTPSSYLKEDQIQVLSVPSFPVPKKST